MILALCLCKRPCVCVCVCVPNVNSWPDTAAQCNISLSCRHCLPLLCTARRYTLFASHDANKCMQDRYTHTALLVYWTHKLDPDCYKRTSISHVSKVRVAKDCMLGLDPQHTESRMLQSLDVGRGPDG